MQDITQGVENSCLPPNEVHMGNLDTGIDIIGSDDISPHYNDGIVDLEESIENLRKLLEIKEKNSLISGASELTSLNYMRFVFAAIES